MNRRSWFKVALVVMEIIRRIIHGKVQTQDVEQGKQETVYPDGTQDR